MLVDLSKEVKAYGADGAEIKGPEGALPTLKFIALASLRRHIDGDEKQSLEEKDKRYLLTKYIDASKEPVELSQDAIDLLISRTHRVFLDLELALGFARLIQNKELDAAL